VVPRKDARQPMFLDLDARLQKTIRFSGNCALYSSAEGFNIAKHAIRNYGNSLCGTLVAPSSARYRGPRQMQVGSRFVF